MAIFDNSNVGSNQVLPVFGMPHTVLAEVASQAARDAAVSHIRAGRLAPSPDAASSDEAESGAHDAPEAGLLP